MTLIELTLATAAALTGFPEQEIGCMATNIYHEARGESLEGQWLVGSVVMNRVVSNKFPGTPCDVVHEWRRPGLFGCQFSWYCDTASLKEPMNGPVYTEAMEVAKKVLLEGFRIDSVKGALYYHADYINPGWKREKVTKVGRHIFYK